MHVMHTATHAHSDTLVWFGLRCRVVSECVDYHFHTCSGKVEGRFALISSSTLFRLCLGSAGDPFGIFLFLICPLYHFYCLFLPAPIFLFRVYSLLNAASFSFYSIWPIPHFSASHWFCDISLFFVFLQQRVWGCLFVSTTSCRGALGTKALVSRPMSGFRVEFE